jgi:hypothetical protein
MTAQPWTVVDDEGSGPEAPGASGVLRYQGLETTWELVTPRRAEEYLATRGPNRAVMGGTVLRLAQDMAADHWQRTHQGIAFDDKGHLLDGQHRLQAILQSGRPQTLLVTRGLDSAALEAIDIGAKRSTYQVLAIAGHKNASTLAGALSLALLFYDGRLKRGWPYPTVAEQLQFLYDNPSIVDGMEWGMYCNAKSNILPASVVAFAYHEFRQHAPVLVEGFMQELITGEELAPRSPILAVRQWLLDDRRGNFHRRNRWKLLGVTIKAWNAVLQERELRLPREGMREDEPMPAIVSRHV